MARKHLIKGANATRVEERIARVPEDIDAPLGIFGALKALEAGTVLGTAPAPQSASPAPLPRAVNSGSTIGPGKTPKSRPQGYPRISSDRDPKARSPLPPRAPATPAPRAEEPTRPEAESERVVTPREAASERETASEKEAARKAHRLGPADFSAAERAEIVRCCSDYRNRLPIYLMAVQRELAILDSVIAKCAAAEKKRDT